ncbi:hypothetical protein D3C71_1382730 [compost metagenome]
MFIRTENVPSSRGVTLNLSVRVPLSRVKVASCARLPLTSKLKGMGSPSMVNSPRHTPSAGNGALAAAAAGRAKARVVANNRVATTRPDNASVMRVLPDNPLGRAKSPAMQPPFHCIR